MSKKKHSYEVVSEYGCGGQDWTAAEGEIVKLTLSQAKPFLAKGLLVKTAENTIDPTDKEDK